MTLHEARERSAYLMRSKRAPRRMYTPSEYDNRGKEKAIEDERPRRSIAGRRVRYNDNEDEEAEDEEEEQPQPVVRTKIPPKRGRATRSYRRK